MNLTKRLLISMLTLLCCTGAWASSIPGALSGRFTINASGEKVLFSQGNLQYVGTWQFAENQWDCFSTSQYNDHRDLFGWGTGDAPNKVSNNDGDYDTFTDWGTNAITNGGNTENSGWRTLTKDEWVYLFYSRENAATLFGFGSVNGMNGLIILPDNWTTPEGASFTASTTLGLTNQGSYYHNGNNDNYSHNTYTAEQWAVMESAGAVFLPAAAYRHWVDSNIKYTDLGGFYWSSTPYDSDKAYYLTFYYNDLDPQFNEMRYGGRPVRLVRSSLDQDNEGYYLIGSAQDWQDFAAIVNNGTNPAANAKMTADIDLGDDQTHIGDTPPYGGTFDGQGHKLNVNYYSSSSATTVEGGYSIAPFRNINGATIKNLAVTGNITGYMHCAGVVGYAVSASTNLINNVTVSANITILNTHGGGFIGHNETATTTIQDCLFNGTINGKSGGSTVGVFFGWSGSATMSLINCLENGSYTNCSTFTPTSCPGYAVPTVTNCYYAVSGSYPGTHATSTTLADGTIATALQNGRSEVVWVQDPVTNQPMLAIFANIPAVTLTDGEAITALEAYAEQTCKVIYSRSFTAGMSSTVCLPFAFAKGSVGTFYTFTGISKSGSEYIADMTEYTGDNLEANTPYLFLPSATGNVDFGGTYAIPASLTAGSTVSGDWTFLATYETVSWTEAPTGIYGFSAQNVDAQGISQGEFVKVGAYVRIKPMRCYLKYDDGNSDYAGARSMTRGAEAEQLPETIKVRLIGANGEVTSIGSLQTKTGEVTFDSDAWYTLEGVQLNGKPTRKGIYVNNGKKVIIK